MTVVQPATYWATRHETFGPGWVEHYLASYTLPHRLVLAEAMRKLVWSSALELGCHAGPNLKLLAERFPGHPLEGIDINPVAISAGWRIARAEGWGDHVSMRIGDLRTALVSCPDRSHDVVFSVYALAYLAPLDLYGVLREAVRVTRRYLLLMEPMAFGGPSELVPDLPYVEYRHDYVEAALAAAEWAQRDVRTSILMPVDVPMADRLSHRLTLELEA